MANFVQAGIENPAVTLESVSETGVGGLNITEQRICQKKARPTFKTDKSNTTNYTSRAPGISMKVRMIVTLGVHGS
jgi:hypothetical protein